MAYLPGGVWFHCTHQIVFQVTYNFGVSSCALGYLGLAQTEGEEQKSRSKSTDDPQGHLSSSNTGLLQVS